MKKLLLLASLLCGGLLSAQTYPFYEGFDGVTTSGSPATGPLPAGWTTGFQSQFKVYGMENLAVHGWSAPNACSVEMTSTHTADTLITPPIGAITANTKLSVSYRFVNKLNYPQTGTTLGTGDKITIDAYLGTAWQNGIATIDNTTNPVPLNSYTTYTYNCTTCGTLVQFGFTTIKIRMDVARANGDWYLDIDNFIVADIVTGIQYSAFDIPALAVAPNPSHGNFWIWMRDYKGTDPVTVNMFNNMGQLVKSVTTSDVQYVNQVNIDTEGMARGVYMVEVSSKNGVSKTKVVVE